MPTASQVEELTRECTWTLITLDGVDGYNVKGKNGNSIFTKQTIMLLVSVNMVFIGQVLAKHQVAHGID